ncbi:hypothetical protein UFOVP180_50 [uncultured Caudovirales phage]|uniref:Uncharacterized protein n=1 Tax=uncultured Caudovirales phage TaxID=2100421 RepID=A0A6J7WGV6_9CAUD|nr:hypothetical protein UFOVP180_50 [uncultured Caudovirales phage]
MDKKKFEELTKTHLRWNKKAERWVLKPQLKQCDDCSLIVKDRKVEAAAYRLGTQYSHFKHKCRICKTTLFNGEEHLKKRKYIKIYLENYK